MSGFFFWGSIDEPVENASARRRKPKLVGDELRVEGQTRTGERTRAERRHVDAFETVAPAVEVAAERPEVREQMVREQHGLGALQVGVAGQIHVGRFFGPP
jgi:hypothetical protein